MTTVNTLTLIGYLGANPEVRYMTDGGATTTVSIATSDSWKDKEGQHQSRTEWHQVVFFRKMAEILAEYARKGTLVYVTGPVRKRQYTGKDQQEHTVVELHARTLKVLSRKDLGEGIDDVPVVEGNIDDEGDLPTFN
ncbi:single-stranded DNA-binding protein [Fluviibacter phosphoraccumulans]|uniref:single-stranded DNA-binding protein n=1 Tax=Fluviibacter phosphoraccumulans TaxID=1751046 RepID=UPI0024E26587|nr:single-stranded DNA-binding protein [Fluviibacter phosphoraccumulans]